MNTDAIFLRANCKHCNNAIEYPLALRGESIECPHCGQFTLLQNGQEQLPAHPIPPARPMPPLRPVIEITQAVRRGKIKRKSEFAGTGALVQIVGVVCCLTIIGAVIGIPLILWGSINSRYPMCSACGTRLGSWKVQVCPACQCEFTK